VASNEDVGAPPNRPKAKPESLCSSIGVAFQRASEIVPGWLLPIAAAFVKVTLPKFASGTTRQRPVEVQAEGASAIHSADVTSSGSVVVTVRVNRVPRVTSLRLMIVRCPFTTTAAVIVSPGAIFS
jgi:hypothetical protein